MPHIDLEQRIYALLYNHQPQCIFGYWVGFSFNVYGYANFLNFVCQGSWLIFYVCMYYTTVSQAWCCMQVVITFLEIVVIRWAGLRVMKLPQLEEELSTFTMRKALVLSEKYVYLPPTLRWQFTSFCRWIFAFWHVHCVKLNISDLYTEKALGRQTQWCKYIVPAEV